MDDEIRKNINKCSRCALCLKYCPVYNIKKDENTSPRGLICKLGAFLNNQLSKNEIKKDLKICLNCSKCKKNCPSKVDTFKIFGYKNAELFPSKISQRVFLFLKLMPLKMLYILNFFKFKKQIKAKNSNILYFKGCVAKAQHKITFLDKLYKNPDFSCCGLPYLTGGDIKNYNKSKKNNIELIKKADKVIFDCASCYSSVKEYDELSDIDKEKLVFLSNLDLKYELKEKSKYKNKKITFHKPCHLDDSDFKKIENILSNIKGIEYIQMENIDNCCGFGGSYFIFHPLISAKIALRKANDIKKTKADLILTACPSCTLGIRFNQILSLNFKKTLELRDFINNELIFKD